MLLRSGICVLYIFCFWFIWTFKFYCEPYCFSKTIKVILKIISSWICAITIYWTLLGVNFWASYRKAKMPHPQGAHSWGWAENVNKWLLCGGKGSESEAGLGALNSALEIRKPSQKAGVRWVLQNKRDFPRWKRCRRAFLLSACV